MVQTLPPPAHHARGGGSSGLLVLCAAAGLAVLAAVQMSVFGLFRVANLAPGGGDWVGYVSLAVAALGLLYWRLAPRQSWFVLLLLGGLAAIPAPLLQLAPDLFADWMRDPYLLLWGSCQPLLMVGTLALSTWVWRTGRRDAGAVLIGAVVAVPALAGFLGGVLVGDHGDTVLTVIGLVVAFVSLVLTIVARASGLPVNTDEPAPRPSWAVTIGGAVASVAPMMYFVWQAPSMNMSVDGDPYADFARHMLIVGLIMLAVGVIGGIAAGPRVLTTGVAVGSLLAAITGLTGSAVADLHDLPVALPVTVVVLSLAAGIAVGVLRARLIVGLAGLGLLVVGLLVLYLVFLADDPIFDNDVTNVLTPILLVIAIVAIMAVLAVHGAALAPLGEAPAAIAGVAGAVTAGLSGILTYVSFNPPEGSSEALAGYPPAMVLIVLAAGLTIVVHRRWYRAALPTGEQPTETVPVGETGTERPTDEVS